MNARHHTDFQQALRWATLESNLQAALSAADSARVRCATRELGEALKRVRAARMAIFAEGQRRG